MSREIRRVPADWQHPIDEDREPYRDGTPRYQPMFDRSFAEEAREWLGNCMEWEAGTHEDCAEEKEKYPFYWQWAGDPPDDKYYIPGWPDEQRTHFQMYETTSEGTPISPVFATPEEVARWCADNGASAFGGQAASYESWLRVALGGYAPSAVMHDGVMQSGVEFLGKRANTP